MGFLANHWRVQTFQKHMKMKCFKYTFIKDHFWRTSLGVNVYALASLSLANRLCPWPKSEVSNRFGPSDYRVPHKPDQDPHLSSGASGGGANHSRCCCPVAVLAEGAWRVNTAVAQPSTIETHPKWGSIHWNLVMPLSPLNIWPFQEPHGPWPKQINVSVASVFS